MLFLGSQKKSVHTSSDIIRKLLVLTKVSVSNETSNILKQQHLADNFFKNIFEIVPPPYRRKGKRMWFENRLCIPEENCAKISYMATILLFMEDIDNTTKQTH